MSTAYTNLDEISESQKSVMEFVQWWVHTKKTPIPLKEIIVSMKEKGMGKDTVIYSLKILVRDGFIRRAYTVTNKTSFVQLRTV